MKRLIFIASLAMLAVGCQKTEIQNEVLTPIGFSTEVGKQTRAIVQDDTYNSEQPFAVYAYGHQENVVTKVMDNVEISFTEGDPNATTSTNKWAASVDNTVTTKYYWPNDPTTTLNFYAYSPAYSTSVSKANKNHQKLNGTISHSEEGGITVTGYTHTNMYVDFMVADPVLNATYSDQDGTTGNATSLSSVPLTFNHRMAQIVFKVKTNEEYPNINFKLQSITLNNIKNKGDITSGVFTNATSGDATYVIYPAKAETDANGAPGLSTDQQIDLVIDKDVNEDSEIIPVTMIPQAFDNNQSFTVVYKIDGTGVATETITKNFKFSDAELAPIWYANKKITYTLTISLNEITFEPSVATWSTDNAEGSYDDPEV